MLKIKNIFVRMILQFLFIWMNHFLSLSQIKKNNSLDKFSKYIKNHIYQNQ